MTSDKSDQECLDLIAKASELYKLAEKSHSKSEAKRYRSMAEYYEQQAVELQKKSEKEG